jgi:hypothetical protein
MESQHIMEDLLAIYFKITTKKDKKSDTEGLKSYSKWQTLKEVTEKKW